MLDSKKRLLIQSLSENIYHTSEELGELLGVSSKTARSMIKAVREELEQNGAVVEAKSRKGFRLVITDQEKFDRFCHPETTEQHFVPNTGEERVFYILVMLLSQVDYIKLEDIADETDLRGVLRAIRTKLEWAWEDTGDETTRPRVTCSMGAACYPIDSKSYDELFLQADKALYIATEKGNNRYVIYDVNKHGAALPNSERSTADLYANVPKSTQSKAGFVADVARSLLHQPLPDMFSLLQGIGEQFGVDGIHIFAAPEQTAVYSWGHPVNGTADVLLADPFAVGFGEDAVCVVDNINALENVADDAYRWFAAQNMLGAVLYRMMHEGKPMGVIAFGLFGRFRKWSTLDVNHLTVLGGILAGLMESHYFSKQNQ